jgi:hypothetical protein
VFFSALGFLELERKKIYRKRKVKKARNVNTIWKELLLSAGLSVDIIRSIIASNLGTKASRAGTIKPHTDNNAAAQTDRRMLDFPPPLGPVSKNIDFMSIVLGSAFSQIGSFQYGIRSTSTMWLQRRQFEIS